MSCWIKCKSSRHWLFFTLLVTHYAHSASPTPEVQSTVRDATFEVVMQKPASDPLAYEKPLPLDLIPFSIRSDKYWSIGTAFALGSDQYATAAHVFLSAIGSQFGVPALRDGAGHVYAVNRILKFSAQEDFVVFDVFGHPPAHPLPSTTDRKLDDVVFAVGNALGEGIVIRDGLLTSETPEQQDGRWKWLRFSAAASPGNSGGPLLDARGNVLGIVTAKSPGENLNYALPIERVLNAGTDAAGIDGRYSVRLPNAREAQVATLKAQIPLPRSFADFAGAYKKITVNTTLRDQKQLRDSMGSQLFPKGNSAKLLATVYTSPLPAIVQQDQNDVWDAVAAENVVEQVLPGHGLVSVGKSLGIDVFRLSRPVGAADDKFYQDSKQFMDLLLKGLKLPRSVGDQSIRIVSLEKAQQENALKDQYGRRWQVTQWPLGYIDSYVVCYALPVPEGYVGLVQLVPSSQLEIMNVYLAALADAVYVDYAGTLKQWRAFLARRDLRPRVFDETKLTIDPEMIVKLESPRLKAQIGRTLVNTTEDSELVLRMAYMLDGDKAVWDIGGLNLYQDRTRQTYVGLERHVKPADDSAPELLQTWNQMSSHGLGFNGVAGHDEQFKEYWIHEAVSAPWNYPGIDPKAAVLYDVYFGTQGTVYPRDMEESERRMIQATHILER